MIDPIALSRDIGRVSDRLTNGAADPFADLRYVATQSTYREVADDPGGDPLVRDALLRWIEELLQVRIGADLTGDEAEAIARIDERFANDPPRTFAEARRALVVAATSHATKDALVRLAELAPPVAAVRRERRARRIEADTRLGFTPPFAAAVAPLATSLLDATEGLATDLRKRARITTAAEAIHGAFARDAADGWPAHLSARWLEDVFGALVPRKFESPPLPEAIGGASFVRAASLWGHAMRLAGTARSLPFVLARDPHPVDAHRFGAVLALAVVDPAFQKKKLGLSARAAAAQARALRGALLFAVRVHAARLLLAAGESIDGGTFEELTTRAFGAPLPRALRDAWPEPRPDEAARFAGGLAAHAFARDLVDRFDEDWFANPKAGQSLAAIAAGPVFVPPEIDERVPLEIARAFERALG